MPAPYPSLGVDNALGVYHFSTPGGVGHADLVLGHTVTGVFADPTALANKLQTDYGSNMFVGISNQVSFDSVHVVWNNGGVLSEGDSTGASVNGGVGVAPLTINGAALVHKTTGLIGRQHRGRMYIPGIAGSWITSDGCNITSAHVTDLQTAADAWLAQLHTDGVDLCVLHRSPATPSDLVTALVVRQLLATQRRRLRKAAHR